MNDPPTGGQRLNPAFVSDIEKKVLSRTGEMKTDQTLNEGLARLGRSGFHLLRGRNFLHWFWQGKFSIKNQRLWRALDPPKPCSKRSISKQGKDTSISYKCVVVCFNELTMNSIGNTCDCEGLLVVVALCEVMGIFIVVFWRKILIVLKGKKLTIESANRNFRTSPHPSH